MSVTIKTPRLMLRPPELGDREALAALSGSDRSARIRAPYTRDKAWRGFGNMVGHWALRKFGLLVGIEEDSSTAVLSACPCLPEHALACSVRDARTEGKCLAAEAALATPDWAYTESGLSTLVRYIDADNTRPAALAKRVGCVINPNAPLIDGGEEGSASRRIPCLAPPSHCCRWQYRGLRVTLVDLTYPAAAQAHIDAIADALPRIEADRLALRIPGTDDLEAMTAFLWSAHAQFYGGPMDSNRAWRKFAPYVGQWTLRGYGMSAVTLTETGEIIGMADPFHPAGFDAPEMSWQLAAPEFEGKGYASEACRAILHHLASEHRWDNVISFVNTKNHSSRTLAERLATELGPNTASPLLGCDTDSHPLARIFRETSK